LARYVDFTKKVDGGMSIEDADRAERERWGDG
jgi:hypothetical protein